jgi:predicted nucleic acid-binding protein
MALKDAVFFDTSVLLAGLIDLGPATAAAQRVMDALAAGRLASVRTAWHCCLEFYSVATRLPPELRLTPADAFRLIETEILARMRVDQLPSGSFAEFLRAAAREPTVGGRIYDAHIAEVARTGKARVVVTDNRRHFASLMRHGIRVLTIDECASEIRKGR